MFERFQKVTYYAFFYQDKPANVIHVLEGSPIEEIPVSEEERTKEHPWQMFSSHSLARVHLASMREYYLHYATQMDDIEIKEVDSDDTNPYMVKRICKPLYM